MTTLIADAVRVLTTADAKRKCLLSRELAAKWLIRIEAGEKIQIGGGAPPDFPARPDKPELKDPKDVPRRRPGSEAGRIALLHAIAHIELNAVDLHWDVVARFTDWDMPVGFFEDWLHAADDESKHFMLVSDLLEARGSHYGALAAHAGMWRAATDTEDDLSARLAVVPMVLEARGLDVTPGMIALFEKQAEPDAVATLQTIYAEEVSHVAYGSKWFHFLCGRENLDPKPAFHRLVRKYFHSPLKPPFNEEKRAEAGLPPDFYWPLAEKS